MFEPKVAVIIPVKGPAPHFARCLDYLSRLEYANYEVIIVEDGLQPEVRSALEQYNGVVKILFSSRGPSFARNLAAGNTGAELLAFTDCDCLVDKYWLKELALGLEKYPRAVSCGGIQKLPPESGCFEKRVFKVMSKAGGFSDYVRSINTDSLREVNHNPSCNVIYRRDILIKEGGFLEGLWPGEDVELDYRLISRGYKIILNPKAIVWHYKPSGLFPFLNMMYRYGESQGWLLRKRGIFRRPHLFPLLMVIVFAVIMTGFRLAGMFLWAGGGGVLLFIFMDCDLYSLCLAALGCIYFSVGFYANLIRPAEIKK